jgi:DNA-binding winged helix-turn-helix (wHTH) protein
MPILVGFCGISHRDSNEITEMTELQGRNHTEEISKSTIEYVGPSAASSLNPTSMPRQGPPTRQQERTMETPVDAFRKSRVREIIIPASGSTTPSGCLPLAEAPALAPLLSDSAFDERRDVRTSDTDQPLFKGSNHADVATSEILFGPFRLLPAQLLLLEGDKPVPLGSRALHILMVLLERPGELVTRQELMARVWPNLVVEPATLTVHISALRRALRDGRDGNRFIINIRGRGYCFVTPTR